MSAINVLASLFLTAVGAHAPSAAATDSGSESRAVIATVQTLLDSWREADAKKAASVLHPQFREVTLHLDNGEWKFFAVTREQLLAPLDRIGKGDWDDTLIDPKVEVDGPIANLWSHYRFRTPFTENGVFHDDAHCGIETFQLYKIDGRWLIVNFADTHVNGCPAAH
ncbi:MAG: nuclear transport factor 2 family protein [Dokdonella sp.]